MRTVGYSNCQIGQVQERQLQVSQQVRVLDPVGQPVLPNEPLVREVIGHVVVVKMVELVGSSPRGKGGQAKNAVCNFSYNVVNFVVFLGTIDESVASIVANAPHRPKSSASEELERED